MLFRSNAVSINQNSTDARASRRSMIFTIILAIALLVGVGVGAWYFLVGRFYVSTDDAYVEANKLMVSTDVSGLVSEVDVKEGQSVHRGDVLFKLDPKPFEIALVNTESQLAQSVLNIRSMEQDYKRMLSDIEAQRAQVDLAQTTYNRQTALIKIGGTAQVNVEQARATLETAKSQLTALGDRKSTRLNSSH